MDSRYKCPIARNPMIPLVAGGGFATKLTPPPALLIPFDFELAAAA
jgi:hypothetical protein